MWDPLTLLLTLGSTSALLSAWLLHGRTTTPKRLCRRLRLRPTVPLEHAGSSGSVAQCLCHASRARGTVVAPLSGREVIGYRLLVQMQVGAAWVPWRERLELASPQLSDGRGSRAQLAGHVLALFVGDPVVRGEAMSDQRDFPSPVWSLLARPRRRLIGTIEDRPPRGVYLRWSEYVFEPGSELLVQGKVRRVVAADGTIGPTGGHALRQSPTKAQFEGTLRNPALLANASQETLCARLGDPDASQLIPGRPTRI